MPKLLASAALREAVAAGTFVRGGELDCIEGLKYDFRMGSSILKAGFADAVEVEHLSEAERVKLFIEPGEVVFVKTRESLALPNDMIALLSPKRKLAHNGIIVLGGFSIDPNYVGPLWIGMYNFSSSPFPIRPGRKLIAAMFYRLEKAEIEDFPTPESQPEDNFPDELVKLINNYHPIEINGLSKELQELKGQFIALRTEMMSDKEWISVFKDSLNEHNGQLDKLITGLKEEQALRLEGDKLVSSELARIGERFIWLRSWTVIVGLFVAALLGWGVPKLLDGMFSKPPATAPAPAPAPAASQVP